MNLEKLSIEELDKLSTELYKMKAQKLREERKLFIKNLLSLLESAPNNWDLCYIDRRDEGVFSVDDLIAKVKSWE